MDVGTAFNQKANSAGEWEELLALGTPRSFHAGDTLYMQGDRDVGLFFLKKGRIKNCVYFPNGTEKTTFVLEAPSITGETAVIDNGESLICAVAVTDVEVQVIPAEKALEYFLTSPNLMLSILRLYAKKIRGVQLQADSVVLSTPQKLARMLVNFNVYGVFCEEDTNRIHVTHEQLAGFLGTTRPKITNALNAFEQARFIRKGRGTIEILDYDGLKAIFE